VTADRDPEAEAEEKTEEDKIAGAEEEPAAAVETGFGTGGDWEVAPAGFAAATQGTGWDGANEEWSTAPAAAGEWSGEAAKESQW
jgi:small subunit ribosomal protein SAe